MITAAAEDFQHAKLIETARQVVAARTLRNAIFPPEMFSDFAWEILLALYLEPAGQPLKVIELEHKMDAPASTLRRWFDYLEHQGLISVDRKLPGERPYQVCLTEQGSQKLDLFLLEVERGFETRAKPM